jgi:type IV secretion system protein TrbL
MGSAASASWQLGQSKAGAATIGAGMGGMAKAAAGAIHQKAASGIGLSEAIQRGRDGAWAAMTGGRDSPQADPASGGEPSWAQSLRRQQTSRHRRQVALHSLQQGDRGGGSATPDIRERND